MKILITLGITAALLGPYLPAMLEGSAGGGVVWPGVGAGATGVVSILTHPEAEVEVEALPVFFSVHARA